MKSKINLKVVQTPKIGNKYHVSWSRNPYMTWTLLSIYSDGRCLLSSKQSRFETQLGDLRVSSMVPNVPKPAKQLEIPFKHQLILT